MKCIRIQALYKWRVKMFLKSAISMTFNLKTVTRHISLLPCKSVLQNQKWYQMDILRERKLHLHIGSRRHRDGLGIGNFHSVVLYRMEDVQHQKSRLVVHKYVYISHCMGRFGHPIFCRHCNDPHEQFSRPYKSCICLLIPTLGQYISHYVCLHILDKMLRKAGNVTIYIVI